MNDKYKVIEKELGIKDSTDNKKFKITVKGEELDCSKEDYKKNENQPVKLKVDIIEMDGDKEKTGTDAIIHRGKLVDGVVKRGFLSDSIELKEQLADNVTLKEKLLAPVEG